MDRRNRRRDNQRDDGQRRRNAHVFIGPLDDHYKRERQQRPVISGHDWPGPKNAGEYMQFAVPTLVTMRSTSISRRATTMAEGASSDGLTAWTWGYSTTLTPSYTDFLTGSTVTTTFVNKQNT